MLQLLDRCVKSAQLILDHMFCILLMCKFDYILGSVCVDWVERYDTAMAHACYLISPATLNSYKSVMEEQMPQTIAAIQFQVQAFG